MHRAILSGATCTFGGSCSTQRGCAKPQRGANEQLAGALSSEGGVPGMDSSRAPRLAPCTVEAGNPLALGCTDEVPMSRRRPCPTIGPAYVAAAGSYVAMAKPIACVT